MSVFFVNRKRRHFLYCSIVLWLVYQSTLTLFWGFMHQGGLLQLLRSLPANNSSDVQTLTIFHKTYMPPRFPFGINLDNTSNPSSHLSCFQSNLEESDCSSIIDLAGTSQLEVIRILNCLNEHKHKRIQLVSVAVIFKILAYSTFCLITVFLNCRSCLEAAHPAKRI